MAPVEIRRAVRGCVETNHCRADAVKPELLLRTAAFTPNCPVSHGARGRTAGPMSCQLRQEALEPRVQARTGPLA
jgi:hypothetical protein